MNKLFALFLLIALLSLCRAEVCSLKCEYWSDVCATKCLGDVTCVLKCTEMKTVCKDVCFHHKIAYYPPYATLPLIPSISSLPFVPSISPITTIPGMSIIPRISEIPTIPRIEMPTIPGMPIVPGMSSYETFSTIPSVSTMGVSEILRDINTLPFMRGFGEMPSYFTKDLISKFTPYETVPFADRLRSFPIFSPVDVLSMVSPYETLPFVDPLKAPQWNHLTRSVYSGRSAYGEWPVSGSIQRVYVEKCLEKSTVCHKACHVYDSVCKTFCETEYAMCVKTLTV